MGAKYAPQAANSRVMEGCLQFLSNKFSVTHKAYEITTVYLLGGKSQEGTGANGERE